MTAERQFTWGARHIDDLILRTRDTDANGTLDETVYAMQDANWNITALADTSGSIIERFAYTPYGQSTVLDANFATDSDGISDTTWEYRFTSRELDSETGLHYFRARYYHDGLGRFVGRDPLVYPNGFNMYAGWFAPNLTDPSGKIAPLVYVVGSFILYECACLYHLNNARNTYNGQSMTREQLVCYYAAEKVINDAVGGTSWQSGVRPGSIRGDGGGNYSMTYVAPGCGSWTFYAASDIDCSSCEKFANTVATIFHESDHGLGSKHPETYCNEAKFLKEKLLPMCKNGFGPCQNQSECEMYVNKQLKVAEDECKEGGDGDI
jgi:RHS repeat-associated protein